MENIHPFWVGFNVNIYLRMRIRICMLALTAVHLFEIKILLFECDLYIDSSFFVHSGCWLTLSLGNLKETIAFLRKTIWYDRIRTIYSIDDKNNDTQFWFFLSHIADSFEILGINFPFNIKVPLVLYFRNIISDKFDCKQGNRKKRIIYYILLLLTI